MPANKSFCHGKYISILYSTNNSLLDSEIPKDYFNGKCLSNKMENNGIAFEAVKTGTKYHLEQVAFFTVDARVNLSSVCNFSKSFNPEKLLERRFKCSLNIQTAFPVRGI